VSPRVVPSRGKWRELRGALHPSGMVIAGIGVAQVLCAIAGGLLEHYRVPEADRELVDVITLFTGGICTAIAGWALSKYGRRFAAATLTRREALLAVVLIWVLTGVVGGAPFVYGAQMSPVDAFFETISGFSTTGATVVTHIERDLSTTLLLWRSLIQWLGGMGIVVLFVAVFPSVGAGAKHMFKGEVPGATSEGLRPRIAQTSFTLWQLYAALTVLEAGLLIACGIDPFEAACHAFTTMSTGGFSTRDASIAAFESPAAEYVVSAFMLIGSVNFALYYGVLRYRSLRPLLRSTELSVFLGGVAITTIVTTFSILHVHDGDLETAFRRALFQVSTFVSSTGYVTDDYMRYPTAIVVLMLALMFVGGCSGSTAGGLKWERLVLLAKLSWAEFHKSFRPALVRVVRMGRSAVPPDVLSDVAVFFSVYVMIIAAGVFFVTAVEGVGFAEAFGATLTCLANSGPAPFFSEADNFAHYSPIAKLFFAVVMLLGRLELFTLFALLVPDFWRR
jgi:trk system potassium uptake protein TrkH